MLNLVPWEDLQEGLRRLVGDNKLAGEGHVDECTAIGGEDNLK